MSDKPVPTFLSSLRTRLIGLVLLAVIPALGLILYTAAEQRREAAIDTQENLLRLTKLAAANQKQLTESTRQLLTTLARLPELRGGNREDCTRLLADIQKQSSNYVGFGVSDPNGNLWCSSLPFTQPVNTSDLLFFRLVRETKRFAVGGYQIDTLSRRPTLGFGYPILDDTGQLQAVLSAGLDLEQINRSILTLQLPEGAALTVVDRNSAVLLRYPDSQQWLGKSIPEAQINQIVLAQAEGTVEARGLDGIERLFAFTRLGDDPVNGAISIRIGVPKSVVVANANRLLAQNLTNLGVVTLLALAAAWVLGDVFLVRKVKSLLNTTQKLRQGELTARTTLANDAGELGQLARSVNDMADALEQRDQQIAILNRNLESQLTELQTTQVALSEREARLQLALTAGRMGTWDWNLHTNTLIWSEGHFLLLGLDSKECEPSYDLWASHLHPHDRAATEAAFEQAWRQQSDYRAEYRIIQRDGSILWIEGRGRFDLDADGQPYRMIGVVVDISDRKQTEEDLRLSRARLSFVLQSTGIGLWLNALPLNTLNWDSRTRELFFVPPEAEPTVELFWSRLHLDDHEPTRLAVEAALRDRTLYEIDHRAVNPETGEIRWIRSSGKATYAPDGTPILFDGINYDISDRKTAELNAVLLSDLGEIIRHANDVDELLMTVCEMTAKHYSVSHCVFGQIDLERDLCINSHEYRAETVASLLGTLRLSDYPSEIIAAHRAGQPVTIDDTATHPQAAALYETHYQPFGYRAYAAQPVLRNQVWVGTLFINDTKPHRWTETEIALLSTIAERTWLAVEKLRSEQALRQSEQQFRRLADAMPQVVWIADAEGKPEYVNQRWVDCTGLTLAQTAKQHHLAQVIHPDDLETTYEIWQGCLETGTLYQTEFRLKRAEVEPSDQAYRWVLCRAVPIQNQHGQITQWYGTLTDLHDRKQAETDLRNSEARYRLLTEAIPQFTWITNAAGQNEYVSQRFYDYTGLTSEEMLDSGWLSIIHPDDLEMTHNCWLEAVNSGQFYEVEYRLRRADGAYRWFLGQSIPLKDEQGRIHQWFGTCTDIEPQKQIEQARLRLLEQEQAARATAEQANRIKDEFLAVLSHELRTPMNPILGWSKLLRNGKLDAAKATQALEVIDRNAQLQMQLIDDLLDISRILQGKLSLNNAPVDLSRVISAAIETVRLAADAKAIVIQPIFSPSAPVVNGDAGRLQQVVWNLLSNAVKFTPSGGQIEVEVFQAGTNAQIQVKDSGKGIKPEFLPYVFEHFRQEDGATTRKFGGLGLGLAIARQIVELHGGQISVESLGEGQGATFIVQIPLASASTQISALEQSIAFPPNLSGLQILVVDDEPDSRDFVAFVLEQAGAIVTSFPSGIEALQKLDQFTFDLMVSDIGMPEMDGYMVMQQIRLSKQHCQVPAIALTAYAGEVNQQQAIAAGFQQHISKPVEPETLVRAIVDLLST